MTDNPLDAPIRPAPPEARPAASNAGLQAVLIDRDGRVQGDLPRLPGLSALVECVSSG